MTQCNFASAAPDDQIVYGACRPDYPSNSPSGSAVDDWIAHMKEQDIERICCLLSEKLDYYDDLLERYHHEFGAQKVRHAPIGDYAIVSDDVFHNDILPFLREAVDESEKVVVLNRESDPVGSERIQNDRAGKILITGIPAWNDFSLVHIHI